MSTQSSEGVFFVVRLPDRWQLCTFRHNEYGPISIPDCWVEVIGALLNIWLAHFEKQAPEELHSRHDSLEKAIGLLVAGYDAFPRGEIRRTRRAGRFVVLHGGELTRSMKVPRREIEDAFGIRDHAKWRIDHGLTSDHQNARRIRHLLGIEDAWEDQ